MLPSLFSQAIVLLLVAGNVITFHHFLFTMPAIQIVFVFRPVLDLALRHGS